MKNNSQPKFIKLSDYASLHNITYRTAWNRFKAGKLPGAIISEDGYHIEVAVNEDKPEPVGNSVAIYCRVSSSENKSNLNSQAERLIAYATARGYQISEVVKEVGSGVNDKRSKLASLLQKDNWQVLIVEHEDRLTRFGFNYIEVLTNKLGKNIEVVNQADNCTSDLMQDLISIIYSFSARMYGLRRSKRKTEKIIAYLEQDNKLEE